MKFNLAFVQVQNYEFYPPQHTWAGCGTRLYLLQEQVNSAKNSSALLPLLLRVFQLSTTDTDFPLLKTIESIDLERQYPTAETDNYS